MPHRGRIGVQVQPMSAELREHFGAPADAGLLVSRVEPDRAAAKGDLRVGDVIVSAGGDEMKEVFDLTRVVGRVPQGEQLSLRVMRDRQEVTLTLNPEGESVPWVDPDHWRSLAEKGMRRGSDELRSQLEKLERRLDELERKIEPQRRDNSGGRT
jgi:serine protease Do